MDEDNIDTDYPTRLSDDAKHSLADVKNKDLKHGHHTLDDFGKIRSTPMHRPEKERWHGGWTLPSTTHRHDSYHTRSSHKKYPFRSNRKESTTARPHHDYYWTQKGESPVKHNAPKLASDTENIGSNIYEKPRSEKDLDPTSISQQLNDLSISASNKACSSPEPFYNSNWESKIIPTKGSPELMQNKEVLRDKYFCTFCNNHTFATKTAWQQHEFQNHQAYRNTYCHDSGRSYNDREQFFASIFSNGAVMSKQSFWGCGFCSFTKPFSSWERRCDHVASHFENDVCKKDWMFSKVMFNLLHQPGFSDKILRSTIGTMDGSFYYWDETSRACQTLLRTLEHGTTHRWQYLDIAKIAYSLSTHIQHRDYPGASSFKNSKPIKLYDEVSTDCPASLSPSPSMTEASMSGATLVNEGSSVEVGAQSVESSLLPRYLEGQLQSCIGGERTNLIDEEFSLKDRLSRPLSIYDILETPARVYSDKTNYKNVRQLRQKRLMSGREIDGRLFYTESTSSPSVVPEELMIPMNITLPAQQFLRSGDTIVESMYPKSFETSNNPLAIRQSNLSVYNSESYIRTRQGGSNSRTTANSELSTYEQKQGSVAENNKGKHERINSDGEDRDTNDRGKRRRESEDYETNNNKVKRLACPYYLREPNKYMNYRSCPGPGWETVHRLKGHLYRCHMRPLQCNRCWESFQSEKELKVHLRLEEICNLEPEMIADGIDKHTEEQLKSKRRVPGVITEVDKWKQVWRILFPEDPEDKIPDPFYKVPAIEGINASGFQEYFKQSFDTRVKNRVRSATARELNHWENQYLDSVIGIARDCITDLLREFRHLGLYGDPFAEEVNAAAAEDAQAGADLLCEPLLTKSTSASSSSRCGEEEGTADAVPRINFIDSDAMINLPSPIGSQVSKNILDGFDLGQLDVPGPANCEEIPAGVLDFDFDKYLDSIN